MKKIMFNDKYGLTDAVLQYRKTMTRRYIATGKYVYINFKEIEKGNNNCYYVNDRVADYREASPYKIGEVVAVAQAYKELYPNADFRMVGDEFMTESAGWKNKMFVRADLMPHQIFITDVRIERLQDISEEDCMREGVSKMCYGIGAERFGFGDETKYQLFISPRQAYAALIDKISGKGTWESNPYVFVYEFELIK